jgi:periplasmic protein TonB
MLDQLVESKSNAAENNRRSGFLVTVFVIMTVILVSGVIYSLFAKSFDMGGGDLELSDLVAPIPVEEAPPPKPEVEEKKTVNADTRTEIIQNMMESPKVPEKISNEQLKVPPRDPNRYTVPGATNTNADNPPPPGRNMPPVDNSTSSSSEPSQAPPDTSAPPPPPPPKASPPIPKQISGGVLNGKATSLPKPAYPPAARAVRASGAVSVQVLIDENGNVVSASAVSGNPLLRAAAVSAARGAKFSPTKLSGQAVKVSGVITYNFVP